MCHSMWLTIILIDGGWPVSNYIFEFSIIGYYKWQVESAISCLSLKRKRNRSEITEVNLFCCSRHLVMEQLALSIAFLSFLWKSKISSVNLR